MKTYRGNREPVCHVRVLEDGGSVSAPAAPHSLPGRELVVPRELVAQAQVFFDWGADGPGTHYLAVALLADLLGPADRAGIKSALPFLRRFLSKLPTDDFEISETVFRAFLYALGPTTQPPPRALPGQPAGPEAASHGRNGADKSAVTEPRQRAEGDVR